jgi:putative ABC transport system substrate-binding protein
MKTVGFNHSGKKGVHDRQIKAFTDVLAVAAGTQQYQIKDLWADHNPQQLVNNASTLLADPNLAVLVAAGGSLSAQTAQRLTTTTSIVFTSAGDLPPPAANTTGICAPTSGLDPERLSKLHDLVPNLAPFGALINSSRSNIQAQKAIIENAAAGLGLQIPDYKSIDLSNRDKSIEDAFTYWASHGYKAALVTADPVFNNHRAKVVQTANIPAIYQWREFVDAGGLMSYGPNLTVAYKLAAMYVGLLLNGKAPTDLPILKLSNFELVINLTTATKLNLTIPPKLLELADDIVL